MWQKFRLSLPFQGGGLFAFLPNTWMWGTHNASGSFNMATREQTIWTRKRNFWLSQHAKKIYLRLRFQGSRLFAKHLNVTHPQCLSLIQHGHHARKNSCLSVVENTPTKPLAGQKHLLCLQKTQVADHLLRNRGISVLTVIGIWLGSNESAEPEERQPATP